MWRGPSANRGGLTGFLRNRGMPPMAPPSFVPPPGVAPMPAEAFIPPTATKPVGPQVNGGPRTGLGDLAAPGGKPIGPLVNGGPRDGGSNLIDQLVGQLGVGGAGGGGSGGLMQAIMRMFGAGGLM